MASFEANSQETKQQIQEEDVIQISKRRETISNLVSVIGQNESDSSMETCVSRLKETAATAPSARKEVFDSLIYVNRSNTSFLQQNSTLNALKMMVLDPDVEEDFIMEEVLPNVITYFQTGSNDERVRALNVLRIIATKSDSLKKRVFASSVSGELVNLLKDGNADLNIIVERMLVGLSADSPETHRALCEAGAIPEFISLIHKGTELRIEAGKFLGAVASDPTASAASALNEEDVGRFIDDLKVGSDKLRSVSGQILRKMARTAYAPEQRQALVSSGIVASLVEMLMEGSPAMRSEAMWLLPILCEQEVLRDEFIANGQGIRSIVNLLRSAELMEERTEAFWTLETLCKDDIMRDAIFQAGAIPDMLQFLQRTQDTITIPAKLTMLSFLKSDPDFISSLGAEEKMEIDTATSSHGLVIEHIVHHLRSDPAASNTVQHANHLLVVLAGSVQAEEVELGFVESGALSVLVDMMQDGTVQEARAYVAAAEAKDRGRKLDESCTVDMWEAKRNAVVYRVLHILATGSSRCCDQILAHGLHILIDIVATKPPDSKVHAARVLAALIRNTSTRSVVLDSSLHLKLLALFHHESGNPFDTDHIPYTVKLLAVELLALMADDNEMCEKLINADIVHQLTHLKHHEGGLLHKAASDLKKHCQKEHRLLRHPWKKLVFRFTSNSEKEEN